MELCANIVAHSNLKQFSDECEKWEKTNKIKKTPPDLSEPLIYFQNYQDPSNSLHRETRCRRFLRTVEQKLSAADEVLQLANDDYWEAWGNIAGELLKRERLEDLSGHDCDRIIFLNVSRHLHNCLRNRLWVGRQFVMKSFLTLAYKSVGYDAAIIELLHYFHLYCKAAISAFCCEPPQIILTSIMRIMTAYRLVASRYANHELPIGENPDELLKKLTNIAFELLEDINAICKIKENWNGSDTWQDAVFCYMFSVKRLPFSEVKKSIFSDFTNHLSRIRTLSQYNHLYPLLDEWLARCEIIKKASQ